MPTATRCRRRPPSPPIATGSAPPIATFEARRPDMEGVFRALHGAGVGTRGAPGRVGVHRRQPAEHRGPHAAHPGRRVRDARRTPRRPSRSPRCRRIPHAEFRRRIRGTFEVPLYLTGDGEPGAAVRARRSDGLPVRQPRLVRRRPSPATCRTAPWRAPRDEPSTVTACSASQGEVNGSLVRRMSVDLQRRLLRGRLDRHGG